MGGHTDRIVRREGVIVEIHDTSTGIRRRCNSGVPGSREVIRSKTGTTLVVYVPAMPIGGAYDIIGTTEDGVFTSTLPSAITYIHRSFTTNLYSLRSAWPPLVTLGRTTSKTRTKHGKRTGRSLARDRYVGI